MLVYPLSRRTSIACRNWTDVRAHEMHTLLCWVGIEWVVISNCNVEALNSGKKVGINVDWSSLIENSLV